MQRHGLNLQWAAKRLAFAEQSGNGGELPYPRPLEGGKSRGVRGQAGVASRPTGM